MSREAMIAEAMTWIGTPYRSSGAIKGVGVNCAQFIYQVAKKANVLASDAKEPKWYTPQLATHSREERLIGYVLSYGAREIGEQDALPGDVVLYRSGLSHGHAAMVVDWPTVIHVLPVNGCQLADGTAGKMGQFPRRFFSLWGA